MRNSVIAVLLVVFSAFAHAQTVVASKKTLQPAIQGWAGAAGAAFDNPTAACQSLATSQGSSLVSVGAGGPPTTCTLQHPQFGQFSMTASFKEFCPSGTGPLDTTTTPHSCGYVYTCDAGYTLSADKATCTKPQDCPMYQPGVEISDKDAPAGCSCPSGTAWQAYSGCRKKCAYGPNELINAGFDFAYNPKAPSTCAMGCEATTGGGRYIDLPDGQRLGALASTGWACKGTTQTATEPDNSTGKGKPEDKKKPPCDAAQGVLTDSLGAIKCIPEGIPSRKPEVEKKKKTETYPDNSTKTTETTTTTDPATGASDTTTTTTSTGGLSGSSGTSTSSEQTTGKDKNGDGKGDGGGGCDSSGKCGGGGRGEYPGFDGLYEKGEKTFSSVLSDFSNGVKDSGMGKAVTGFFKLNSFGGSCPAWSVNVEFLKTSLDIGQYFCNSTAINYLQMFGNVLLIVVSFIAFSWAIL